MTNKCLAKKLFCAKKIEPSINSSKSKPKKKKKILIVVGLTTNTPYPRNQLLIGAASPHLVFFFIKKREKKTHTVVGLEWRRVGKEGKLCSSISSCTMGLGRRGVASGGGEGSLIDRDSDDGRRDGGGDGQWCGVT